MRLPSRLCIEITALLRRFTCCKDPGPVAALPIDHFDGLDCFDDLPRDGRWSATTGSDPMTTPCDIRVLGADDVATMRAMSSMFGTAFGEPASYTEQAPDEAYLQRLLGSDTFIAVAALSDGDVIGGLAAYVLPKFEQARSEVYLYDLAVDERHRRRGVATALIGCLQRVAAERGAWVVFVQADHGDDPAIALYTKLGVREDVLHFDLRPASHNDGIPPAAGFSP